MRLGGVCRRNGRILLANLLQSSRSTFSRGSLLSFFAFKEGMLGTPISVRGGWPTVSGRFLEEVEGYVCAAFCDKMSSLFGQH
jgi:hypothetical protein